MNQKAIILVIALMTAALLGSVGLQIYWISGAVKLNEEQFDKSVFAALRHVAERMEREESARIYKITDIVTRGEVSNQLTKEDLFSAGLDKEQFSRLDSTYRSSSDFLQQNLEGEAQLFKFNRKRSVLENMLYEHFASIPLDERLDLEVLNESLKREIKNVGLTDIPQNFGVFSHQLNAFVIKNGSFVIDVNKPDDPILAQEFNFLQNTKYKVDLFSSQDLHSPGYLTLFFPNRTGYVWSSVWQVLLASVIFTAITLFCFTYTLNIIFKQKKTSDIKNDFINNMTHEFKTPIATISLAADTIMNPSILSNPDKVKRFAEIIKQENKRMNGQVEKVLQMAIIDREELKLKMTDINLHDIIEQAAINFSVQVESRNGVLNTDLQATNADIEGDLTHISNIIHNLLDNANKYSPENPDITIHTRNISGGVEITVEDKGIGLSSASRKMVFDKFYRVSTGNVHDVKGFGLGLSYVKTMVTAHKGNIDVKSDLGKGSSFIIFLPFKVSVQS